MLLQNISHYEKLRVSVRHGTLLHVTNLLPGTPKSCILDLAGCICVILEIKLIQITKQKEKTRC